MDRIAELLRGDDEHAALAAVEAWLAILDRNDLTRALALLEDEETRRG